MCKSTSRKIIASSLNCTHSSCKIHVGWAKKVRSQKVHIKINCIESPGFIFMVQYNCIFFSFLPFTYANSRMIHSIRKNTTKMILQRFKWPFKTHNGIWKKQTETFWKTDQTATRKKPFSWLDLEKCAHKLLELWWKLQIYKFNLNTHWLSYR